MLRGAVFHSPNDGGSRDWASIVAIVFAAIAAISWAVDLTVSLSGSASRVAPHTDSRPIVR